MPVSPIDYRNREYTVREQGKLRLEPIYLGVSALIATLLVYEPALHSFIYFDHFESFITPFSLAALATCAITAAAYAAASGTAARNAAARRKRENVLLGASTAVGYGGFLFLVAFEGSLPIQITVGACAGIASALMLVSWGRVYTGCPIQKALLHIALSCIIGALLMNTMGTLPFPVTSVLFVFLSAASAIIPIVWNKNHPHTAVDTEEPAPKRASAGRMFANLLEPMAGIFLFALVFATLGDHHVYLFYLSFLLGTLLSGLCIIPLVMVNSRRPILTLIYQVVLPLLGLILLVIALIVPDGATGMVARNGFMLFFAFASMLFCASIVGFTTADEFNPGLILGSAVATFAVGGLVGTILAATVGRTHFVTGLFLALTCAYVITLAIRPSVLAWLGKEASVFGTPPPDTQSATHDAVCQTLADTYGLTEREREILPYIAAGQPSSSIARTLFISESTVRGHIHHICQKLAVSSREEIVQLARISEVKKP